MHNKKTMKKTIIITVFLSILLSCSKDNDKAIPTELLTTWKYAEFIGFNIYCSDCTGPYLITDGFTITFNKNGTFTSNELANYPNGTYEVSSSNEITLTYRSSTLSPITKIKRITSLTNNGLVLEPIPICIEGCSERYEKVTIP